MTKSVIAGALTGLRILVAEDEYFIASDTARQLEEAGAMIVGPFATLQQVEDQVERDGFDVALLDIRLDQDLVFPAADMLQQTGVPVAFLTGYDEAFLPPRFEGVPLCRKPCGERSLIAMIGELVDQRSPQRAAQPLDIESPTRL